MRSVHRLPILSGLVLAILPGAVAAGAADANAPAPPAETNAAAPPAGQPLTLAQAEAMALRNQPAMMQARGNTEAAEGRVEQARSNYLPQVNLGLIYQRTTNNSAPQPGLAGTSSGGTAGTGGTGGMGGMPPATRGGFSLNTFNFLNATANASQLIYDFGMTDGRWRAAESSRDAFRWSEQTTSSQVVLNVRRAYFQARAQRDLVDVAAEAVLNQEKHLHQIEAFVTAGIRPQIDLAQARTAVANANVQLVGAQNNYAVSMAQLNQAIGLSADTTYALADSDFPPVQGENATSASLVTQALGTRPELAVLARQRDAQAETVRAIEGNYGPALSATAGMSSRGQPFDRLGTNVFLGLGLSWAILQGGFTRGQVREAKGTLNNLDGQVEAMRLQVRVEVEQARLGVAAAKSSITAAEEALVNAREQLRLAEARYQTGLGSVIELGDAQVAFSNAEAQEVQAKYGLSSARAQLMTAMGTK